jgi:hypothetical protein
MIFGSFKYQGDLQLNFTNFSAKIKIKWICCKLVCFYEGSVHKYLGGWKIYRSKNDVQGSNFYNPNKVFKNTP